jgi:hypothetical protein
VPTVISGQPSAERRRLRSLKGVAVRLGDAEAAARLDAEIRTERLAEYIRGAVDQAPPLNADQRARLARLLRPGGGAA